MLSEAFFKIIGVTSVVTVVGAVEDVDVKRHDNPLVFRSP
jgi:hypothetical protein